MRQTRLPPAELAERLADRLCHDVSSAGQALASGLDLLGEATTEAGRDEAVAFLREALAAQTFKVAYARRAYGAGEAIDTAELKALAEAQFAGLRPVLTWAVDAPRLKAAAGRALLILMQIGAEAAAAGGAVKAMADADGSSVAVELAGPRIMLKEEVRAGLAGEAFAAGLGGRWVQGAYVAALADRAGGSVAMEARDDQTSIRVSFPPDD